MNQKTHIVGGISSGVIASALLSDNLSIINVGGSVLLIAASIFGSQFCDIDHNGSALGKRLPLISKRLKHRGIMHSPLLYVLLACILYLLKSMYLFEIVIVLGVLMFGLLYIDSINSSLGWILFLFVLLYWVEIYVNVIIYNLDYLYFMCSIGFTTGVISHLVLDMLTKAGIPIFYPFSKNKYHILKLNGEKHGKNVQLITKLFIAIFLLILMVVKIYE